MEVDEGFQDQCEEESPPENLKNCSTFKHIGVIRDLRNFEIEFTVYFVTRTLYPVHCPVQYTLSAEPCDPGALHSSLIQ